jgi:hypothetical protein
MSYAYYDNDFIFFHPLNVFIGYSTSILFVALLSCQYPSQNYITLFIGDKIQYCKHNKEIKIDQLQELSNLLFCTL